MGQHLDMFGFLAGSGAAPQALLVVLEFVACFLETQETLETAGTVVLACWLGHLATLGFVSYSTSSDPLQWRVCVCACGRFHVALIYLQVSDTFCVFFSSGAS